MLDISDNEEEIKKQKDKIMKYYGKLPLEYVEYVFGFGKYYLTDSEFKSSGNIHLLESSDLDVLPHFIFKSHLKILVEDAICFFDYLQNDNLYPLKNTIYGMFEKRVEKISKNLKNQKHYPFIEGNEELAKYYGGRREFLHICNLIDIDSSYGKILNDFFHDNMNLEKARRDRAEVIQDF